MTTKRSYTMTTRAESAERTREAVLTAIVELATRVRLVDISLDDVARAAGVSVQTVLRKFGSRDELVAAAVERALREVDQERAAPVGDVRAALELVVDHYEHRGDGVVLLLAQEDTDPQVAVIVERGRALHREWVATSFAPYLTDAGPGREELLDLLAVATDVSTWRLLRRDRGLDRATTLKRMHRLVSALLHEPED